MLLTSSCRHVTIKKAKEKKNMLYLGFDLETGGLDRYSHTITEAYFGLFDSNGSLVDETHLYLKNDNGEIVGEKEAFDFTGINPEEQLANPNTLTYTQGREKLLEMLSKHKTKGKRTHYRFLGQNIIAFDIPFMQAQGLLTEEHIKKAGIGHNAIDTTAIVTFLKDIEMLPSDVGSISSLIEYFNLSKGIAHRAKDDVLMQKNIYFKLRDIMKKKSVENLSVNNDLLKIIEL